MKRFKALLAFVLFAAMRSELLAETVVLPAQKDNTLYEDPFGQTSNGQGAYLFAGRTAIPNLRRGLIALILLQSPPTQPSRR